MEIRSALVTGGLGFVGSAIVDAIHEKYPSCLTTILDISDDAYDSRKESKLPSKTDYVVCDILHPEDLARVLLHVKPDVVIHTAGIVPSLSERYHRGMEKKVQQINVEGTRNVLNATRDAGIGVFVYISSCCCAIDDWTHPYPNIDERWPRAEKSSIYGESKRLRELSWQQIHLRSQHVSPDHQFLWVRVTTSLSHLFMPV